MHVPCITVLIFTSGCIVWIISLAYAITVLCIIHKWWVFRWKGTASVAHTQHTRTARTHTGNNVGSFVAGSVRIEYKWHNWSASHVIQRRHYILYGTTAWQRRRMVADRPQSLVQLLHDEWRQLRLMETIIIIIIIFCSFLQIIICIVFCCCSCFPFSFGLSTYLHLQQANHWRQSYNMQFELWISFPHYVEQKRNFTSVFAIDPSAGMECFCVSSFHLLEQQHVQ